ncbi:MAG: preprotein translocase subunit SecE [Chitinophagales bacterium]|nr:preprotein translocase subunit SecE [Chitinophagales bacterium]
MKGIQLYLQEAYNELVNKVTWPTWEELQESALVVLVASLIFALVVLAMDQAASNVMKLIYKAIIG